MNHPGNPNTSKSTRICVVRPFVIESGRIAKMGECLTVEFFFANQLIGAQQAKEATPSDEADWIAEKRRIAAEEKETQKDKPEPEKPPQTKPVHDDPPENQDPPKDSIRRR